MIDTRGWLGLLAGISIFLTTNVQSQNLSFPDSFNSPLRGGCYCIAVQNDGKVVVGSPTLTRLNNEGSLDSSFYILPCSILNIRAMAIQEDGKIVVGGFFMGIGGQDRWCTARLNPDGSADPLFNMVIISQVPKVYALALQPDGKILVGGNGSKLGGEGQDNLGRLNWDGSRDSDFTATANGDVYAIAVLPDGKILVAGAFTTLCGQTCNYLGRLNPDGTLDTSFVASADNIVRSIAVQADGKVLVGGDFATIGGQSCLGVARLITDGSLDTTFTASANSSVLSLAIQADGSILVGGNFTNLCGTARNHLGRLHADGSVDPTFDPNPNNSVTCLAVQPDGNVLIGGSFTSVAGEPRDTVARVTNPTPATQSLSFDGSSVRWLRGGSSPEVEYVTIQACTNDADWINLGQAARIPGGWQVGTLALPTNATIRAHGFSAGGHQGPASWLVEDIFGPPVLAGQPQSQTNQPRTTATFSVTAQSTAPLSYCWLKNGTNFWGTNNPTGAQTSMLTLTNVLGADSGGYSVIVSNQYGAVTSRVAVLKVLDPIILRQPRGVVTNATNTAQFSIMVDGTGPFQFQWRKGGVILEGANQSTLTLTNLQADDAGAYDVVVTGGCGSVTSSIAPLTVNLSSADSFAPLTSGIYAIAVQPDNKILVGGSFTGLAGQARNYIGRLNQDGSLDTNFNPTFNPSSIYSLALQPDGKILFGGVYVGRLNPDGTWDGSFRLVSANDGIYPYVYSLALQSDGKVLVGGGFATLAFQTHNYLGRLMANGTIDGTFNPQVLGYEGAVKCLALQADGQILVAGNFTNLCGQTRNFIGRLNASGSLDADFNPDPNGEVTCVAVQGNGKILLGGAFNAIGGQRRYGVARLNSDGTLDDTFVPALNSFYPSVTSIGVQTDGKILVGSATVYSSRVLVRLCPDGSLDNTFAPSTTAMNILNALALQNDGKILVSGSFRSFAGQSRTNFARLINTDPGIDRLSFNGSTITWLRAGGSPDVSRATFEVSTNDGISWSSLGSAIHTAGGWQSGSLSLRTNSILRARGFMNGGFNNSSSSFVETTLQLQADTAPRITNHFETGSGQFGFDLTGLIGQTVVLESSTNLVDWAAIGTNAMTTPPFRFQESNESLARFYRLRLQ